MKEDTKTMIETYTESMIDIFNADQNICVLEADLMMSHGTNTIRDRFPERVFDVGVAEANMVSIASGLSAMGMIPIAATFACFASRRAFDQFFISSNYSGLNVKLVGTDPGIAAEKNGGTHMSFEDAGLMRCIPKLVVFEPSDTVSLKKLLKQSIYRDGSTYMRLHRKVQSTIYSEDEDIILGKGNVLKEGGDITLIACGVIMVNEALAAAEILSLEGINATVIDMHTTKPIDHELVKLYAKKTGHVVTCENHQIVNNLGSAVAEVLAGIDNVKFARIGVQDEFGEVGSVEYLKKKFCLRKEDILAVVKKLL